MVTWYMRKRKHVLTLEDKIRIVIMRYGPELDYTSAQEKYATIAKAIGSTTRHIGWFLKRFVLNGFKIPEDRRKTRLFKPDAKRRIMRQVLAPVQEFLLSRDTLIQWANLSLNERVSRLEALKGIKISPLSLSRFYRKHGIKWLATKYRKRREETVDPVRL